MDLDPTATPGKGSDPSPTLPEGETNPSPTLPASETNPSPTLPASGTNPSPTLPASGEGDSDFPPHAGGTEGGQHPRPLPHTRWVEHEVTGVGGHEDAALNDQGI